MSASLSRANATGSVVNIDRSEASILNKCTNGGIIHHAFSTATYVMRLPLGLFRRLPLANPSNKVVIFFSNPIVGIIGWLATIIGLVLTIYFYVEGKENRDLTYYVNPVKAVLVRSGQASRLSASFDDKTVETDITAAQIALWNQGKLAIKKDNILKSVVIYTDKQIPILEATIRKSSRDVNGISLGTENIRQGSITISWNILERNDGCVIQLIYAGDTNTQLLIDGVIEGQDKIRQLTFAGKIRSPDEQFSSRRRANQYLGFFVLSMGVFLVLLCVPLFLIRRRRRIRDKSLASLNKEVATELTLEQVRSLLDRYRELLSPRIQDSGLIDRVARQFRRLVPILVPLTALVYLLLGLYYLVSSQELGPPFGF